MRNHFDELIDRRGTNSIKYEAAKTRPYLREDSLPMWVADMDFATPAPILDAIRARLDRRILGYSAIYDPAFYRAVTRWCRRRFDWEVDPESIITFPGVVNAINTAVLTLTAPRDGVIMLTPVYGPFGKAVDTFGRRAVYSRLLERDGYYSIDFQDLEEKAANPRNTLLLLCSPHNPTGRVFTATELARIGDICFRNNVFVLCDEIHADLVRTGVEHVPLAKLFPNEKRIITCNSPSKTFNMAGCQISNIIVPDEAIRERWRSFYLNHDVNPLSIDAEIAAYNKCEGWLEELKLYLDENFLFMRDYLNQYMPRIPFTIPQGTYLAWVDLRAYGLSDLELEKRIGAAGLFVEYHTDFVTHGEGHIRMNLACPRAVLNEGLRRLRLALEGF